MKKNLALFFYICTFFVLFSSVSMALETRAIDELRKKDVLSDADQKTVEAFIGSGIEELFNLEDFSAASSLRLAIVSRKTGLNETSAQQYKTAFNSAAVESFTKAFGRLDQLQNQSQAFSVRLNLLLLMSEISDAGFVNLAIDNIKSKSSAIRYSAVKCLSSPDIIKQLSSATSADIQRAQNAISVLTEVAANETDGSVLIEIVNFAAGINSSDAEKLILEIAKGRIGKYESWTVSNDYVDAATLKALYAKSLKASSDSAKNDLMAALGQLYSYVIQRYALDAANLSEASKSQVVDVIVGTENDLMSQILGSKVGAMKKAIERNDMAALMMAHDSLLGSSDGKGMIASTVEFYYSIDGENKIYMPKKLVVLAKESVQQ